MTPTLFEPPSFTHKLFWVFGSLYSDDLDTLLANLETLIPWQSDNLTDEGGFEVIMNEDGEPTFSLRSDIGNVYFVHQVLDAEGNHIGLQQWPVSVSDSCTSSLISLEPLIPTIPTDYTITRAAYEQDNLGSIHVVQDPGFKFTDSTYFDTSKVHSLLQGSV